MTRHLGLAEYLGLAEQVTGIEAGVLAKSGRIERADSAAHAPAASFTGQDSHVGLARKAAVLVRRLAWARLLPDGNRRSAWAPLVISPDLGGGRWDPDPPDVDDTQAAPIAIAAHDVQEEHAKAWPRARVRVPTDRPAR